MKKDYPNDSELERTNENLRLFNKKNGGESTNLFLKRNVILVTRVFEKYVIVSVFEFEINPLYCSILLSFIWLFGLK